MGRMKESAIGKMAAASLALLAACGSALGGNPRATSPPAGSQTPAPSFVDVTAASNISYRVGYTRPSLMGRGDLAYQVSIMTFGGAAAGDCDGDGDIDLFITYGNTDAPNGGGGPNRLYLNQLAEQGKGLVFKDVAEQAGVANTRLDGKGNDRHSGPAFADMDGDGDLDLFLGGVYNDPSEIYENDGTCRFTDVTSNSPDIEHMLATHTISAGFGDYDLDGDLDMFLTHWATSDRLYEVAGRRSRQTDHLWRNESDESGIRFVNVSEESGISDVVWLTRTYPGTYDFPFSAQDFDFTFTPTFARINDDAWPDIAIAADFGTTQLAVDNGDGTFHSLENRILREAQFGMGSALADIDNDTDLDIYHTNGFPEPFLTDRDTYDTDASRMFVMNRAGKYREEADARGLAVRTSGRGVGARW
jgi:hypothetical protein